MFKFVLVTGLFAKGYKANSRFFFSHPRPADATFAAMSQAFVREGDGEWLEDIAPTLQALVVFLTRENNGIRVSERKSYTDARGRQVHEMSNGLAYCRNERGQWQVYE